MATGRLIRSQCRSCEHYRRDEDYEVCVAPGNVSGVRVLIGKSGRSCRDFLEAKAGTRGLPRAYLSVSQIKLYLACPLKYRFQYVDRIRKPTPAAFVLGGAVHKAIEASYRQKMSSGSDMPVDVVQDIFAAHWDEAARQDVDWEGEDPAAMKAKGVALVGLYMREVAQGIQPVAVEEKFLIDFSNVDYGFMGFMDVVTADERVRDTKTAKRSPEQDAADREMQLTAYALGYKSLYGTYPKSLGLDVLVATKTPKVVTLDTTREPRDTNRFLGLVGRVARCIGLGLYYPNPTGWTCKVCEYERECAEWEVEAGGNGSCAAYGA